ncbi:MAG TPA: protoporphyrinogen oxidase [Casimicrobiaceae bacterium]|nr:protoporphyrinogen oxidase [Casimicrobiaceae bacterium]
MSIHAQSDYDVVVVGGGISGLTVSYRMQQRGRRVALLDAGDASGGMIASHRDNGFLYESGANSALATPLLEALFDEIGIANARVDPSPRAKHRFIVRDGRLVALPSSPLDLLTTPAFSLAGKLRLLREPWIARTTSESDESIADFARRRLGDEIRDYAVDPFVAGIYAGDPERISARAAFPRLIELERMHGSLLRGQLASARARRAEQRVLPKSFSFRDGMQTLPRAMADRLQTRLPKTPVTTIERHDDKTYTVIAQGLRLRANAVVLSVPADAAASIVESLSTMCAARLREIEYAPIAIVVTAYRKSDVAHGLGGFGFLVPGKERRAILGSLFSSTLFERRAPADGVLITTFCGGTRDPAAIKEDDATLIARVTHELDALIGARNCLQTFIVRWPRAIPQYTLGHLDRIAAIDSASRIDGLFYCANWRGGVSIGDCVASAQTTAQRMEVFLSGRTSR